MGSIQILRRHIIHVMLYYAFVFRFSCFAFFPLIIVLCCLFVSSGIYGRCTFLFCCLQKERRKRKLSSCYKFCDRASSGRKNLADKIDYCFIKFWKTPENVPFYFYRCFLAIPLSRLLCKILIFQWVILRVRLARVNLIFYPFCT